MLKYYELINLKIKKIIKKLKDFYINLTDILNFKLYLFIYSTL